MTLTLSLPHASSNEGCSLLRVTRSNLTPQSVWFRFQQLKCDGKAMAPPCALLGAPQYYDTYWYSNSP